MPPFENCDKLVYVKSGFANLAERAVIAGYLCKIWYAYRQNQCDMCHKRHKNMDVDQCEDTVWVFGNEPFSKLFILQDGDR